MTANQAFLESRQCGERFLFSFAVALIGCLYVILVPLASYLCGTVMATFDAEMPKLIAMLIPLSPWLPVSIGAIGVGMLFWKQASPRKSWVVSSSVPASAAIIIVGVLWVALTLLPVLQLMAVLPQ